EGILELSGSLNVKVNTTGAAINESIKVGADTIDIVFANGDDVMGFFGSVSLQIVNFVKISGDFGFEKHVSGTTTKMLIGASNVTIFLGVGYGTPGALGLQVTGAYLGLVLLQTGSTDPTYALNAGGNAALVGLDGLGFEGSMSVQINETGQAVHETIQTGGDWVNVDFDTAEKIKIFSGSITISVVNVFVLTGTVNATIRQNGMVLVDIPEASLGITVDGEEIFAIHAAIRFAISPTDGFRLLDMRITGFSIMGVGGEPTPDYTKPATDMFLAGLDYVTLPAGSPPSASLAYPFADGEIDIRTLNSRKYIDVTYTDYSSTGIKASTILDKDGEFTFSGDGVGDAIISYVEQMDASTFRYHLADKDSGNEIDLFKAGSVTVSFTAGTWADNSGQIGSGKVENFKVIDGGGTATGNIKIGLLEIRGPSISIEDFRFGEFTKVDGSTVTGLIIFVGLNAEYAAINFGGGVKIEFEDLLGAFEIGIELPFTDWGFGGTGRFMIDIGKLTGTIPEILVVEGESLTFQYDPNYDPEANGGKSQEYVRINSLSVEIIPIKLKGGLEPFTRSDGTVIPGLVVREDGISLGSAYLQYTGTLSIASFLSITGIKVGISDVEIVYGEEFVFNGEVFIAADSAYLFPGQTFEVSITDGTSDSDDEAIRAALTFTDGVPDGFRFLADQVKFKFGDVLSIHGSGIYIDTTATGEQWVASFDSIGATVKAGPLNVTGEMRYFAFTAEGKFVNRPGFGVFIEIGSLTGDSVGWPSWMPIRITSIGIQWRDINNDPFDFVLTLSASISGLFDLPVELTGAVDGIQIDFDLLRQGKFPIIGIQGISVGIKVDLFGGKVSGSLLGGIVKLDKDYNEISATDFTTEVYDRILYMGVAGEFSMAGMEFGIRFAFSELGPLGVVLSAKTPTGVMLVPQIGLVINDFVGGVEFFRSLPSVSEPSDLKSIPLMSDSVVPDSGTWLKDVKKQVINQAKQIAENPNMGGFLAAFTSPMTIYASGKVKAVEPNNLKPPNILRKLVSIRLR
ncbi:MAG: hypothetical protein H8D34_26095, partial [Chloroflexi bacterium]|nr:hypothetical protein [Chloroflexota bacterium]